MPKPRLQAEAARSNNARIRVQVLERPLVREAAIAPRIKRRFQLVSARPEVVVLDCNSYQVNVVPPIKKFRAQDAKVLVLSSSTDRFVVGALLRAGVEGFLSSVAGWRELFAAVDALAEGRRVYGPEVAAIFAAAPAIGMQVVDGQSWELDPVKAGTARSREDPAVDLSRREAQILHWVATGRSNAAIGEALCISAHTVRKHRENLMAKLKLHNVAEVTAFAVRNNLLPSSPAPGSPGVVA